MTDEASPEVAVILPVYRNGRTLRELHRRLCETLARCSGSFEIICVDDACPERSLEILDQIAREDVRVKVVALARNVGQHRALLAGLGRTQAHSVIFMDADLQDPPEAIPALLEELAKGHGAVYAGRRGQFQSRGRMITSRLFKGLIAILTGMPPDAGLFVALSRQAARRVLAFGEGEQPYLTALIACVGLPTASVPVQRSERCAGASSYSGWKRLKMGVRGVLDTVRWRCLIAWRQGRLFTNSHDTA
jgi:glycosyltransferase involved in cell wall biosynthesis